jgi:hypothetical protein
MYFWVGFVSAAADAPAHAVHARSLAYSCAESKKGMMETEQRDAGGGGGGGGCRCAGGCAGYLDSRLSTLGVCVFIGSVHHSLIALFPFRLYLSRTHTVPSYPTPYTRILDHAFLLGAVTDVSSVTGSPRRWQIHLGARAHTKEGGPRRGWECGDGAGRATGRGGDAGWRWCSFRRARVRSRPPVLSSPSACIWLTDSYLAYSLPASNPHRSAERGRRWE